MQDKRWLPTIDDYYISIGYNLDIDTKNLSELKAFLCSMFDITPYVADLFVQIFFREIATFLLQGKSVRFLNFGTFFINSPKTNEKKMTRFNFKAAQLFIKELNKNG